MNKYVCSILLLIIYPVLISFLFNKENNTLTQCHEDECVKSISLVDSIKNSLIKHGLNHTIQHIDQHKRTNNENIYIWEKKTNDFLILYHENHALENHFSYEANRLLAKTCPDNKCDIHKITTHLTEFVDTKNNGFTQYNWYDDVSKKNIIKKSYTDKVNNIYNNNANKTIYISSNFTSNQSDNEINYTKLSIQIISFILFIVLWYLLDIDTLLKSKYYLSTYIFWAIIAVNFIKLLNVKKYQIHIIDQEKLNNRLYQNAGILAGLTLSISLFFRAFLNIGFDRKIAKHILLLYTISFIFAIFSLMHVPMKHTLHNLQTKYYIKNEFLYLTCFFFVLAIVSISLHFQ